MLDKTKKKLNNSLAAKILQKKTSLLLILAVAICVVAVVLAIRNVGASCCF